MMVNYKYLLLFLLIISSVKASVTDFNFGIVLNSKKYQIYRSSSLGKKGVNELWAYMNANKLLTPKTIIYMNDEGYKVRFTSEDFALQEYALQEEYGFKMFHSFDYKNRTYLDGHDPYSPSEDIDLKNNLNSTAIKLFGSDPKDGVDGGLNAFKNILNITLDPLNQPVLIHCLGGKHRTGMVAMAIKYIQSENASDVVKNGSLIKTRAEVEYEKYAGSSVRSENIYFIRKFIKSDDFLSYVKKYREEL
jgi:hypothetical protein